MSLTNTQKDKLGTALAILVAVVVGGLALWGILTVIHENVNNTTETKEMYAKAHNSNLEYANMIACMDKQLIGTETKYEVARATCIKHIMK